MGGRGAIDRCRSVFRWQRGTDDFLAVAAHDLDEGLPIDELLVDGRQREGSGRLPGVAEDPSAPAGPKNRSMRASAESTWNPCATSRGPKTIEPATASITSSPWRTRTSPDRTTKNSSSLRWMWIGDANPLGASSSSAAKLPAVRSLVASSTPSPPLNQRASPSPGPSA
jgi:hypothetical protein